MWQGSHSGTDVQGFAVCLGLQQRWAARAWSHADALRAGQVSSTLKFPYRNCAYCLMPSIPLHGLVATCVSAGWDHSGAVVDGRVYTWGRGVKGQLGDGLRQSKKMVNLVTSHVCLSEIFDLFAYRHSLQPFRVNFPDDATLTTPSFVSLKCGRFVVFLISSSFLLFCDLLVQLLHRGVEYRRVQAQPPSPLIHSNSF
jgi:hypothetical protein